MKVRLYHDGRVSAKDAPDAWSIYCPYPKKYQRVTGIKGVYLGCKPTDEGRYVVVGNPWTWGRKSVWESVWLYPVRQRLFKLLFGK